MHMLNESLGNWRISLMTDSYYTYYAPWSEDRGAPPPYVNPETHDAHRVKACFLFTTNYIFYFFYLWDKVDHKRHQYWQPLYSENVYVWCCNTFVFNIKKIPITRIHCFPCGKLRYCSGKSSSILSSEQLLNTNFLGKGIESFTKQQYDLSHNNYPYAKITMLF